MKRQHCTNRISASKGTMKESWKTINKLLIKRSKSTSIVCLKESWTETRDKTDASNAMNNFFSTIGRDLVDKMQPAANPLLSGEYEVNEDKAKFHFKTIELKDIRDAFAKVEITKSFGIDNISSYFMKLAFPSIENSLAFLFTTFIETSQFQDSWKVARITPIFKDGDRTVKSTYHPIAVLPVISKLFETLVFNQLYHYMKENGLFTSDQSGFLCLHSTLTC